MIVRLTILGLTLLLLTGCYGNPRAMTVLVRDHETQEPVANATVRTRPLYFYRPDPETGTDEFIRSSPPGADTVVTDDAGVVRINGNAGGPMSIIVTAVGYDLLWIEPPGHPDDVSGFRLDRWFGPADNRAGIDSDLRTLEIRIEP